MKTNIGAYGKMIRFYLALGLIVLSFLTKSDWTFIIGLFVLFESLNGWCAVNQILGKNSCPIDKSKSLGFRSMYIRGINVLMMAIILNMVATYFGIMTWYKFLEYNNEIRLIDLVFLLIVYPFALGAVLTSGGECCKLSDKP